MDMNTAMPLDHTLHCCDMARIIFGQICTKITRAVCSRTSTTCVFVCVMCMHVSRALHTRVAQGLRPPCNDPEYDTTCKDHILVQWKRYRHFHTTSDGREDSTGELLLEETYPSFQYRVCLCGCGMFYLFLK